MGQMFCVECPFLKKTLLDWFNKKFRFQYLQISPFDNLDMKETFLLIDKMKNVLFANFH